MPATPKVSVITPAYKTARYIGQAIESVQAQTLTDWEMIIVDDASPDETAQVVRRYLDDPRIKLLQNEQNMGAGYTRRPAPPPRAAQGYVRYAPAHACGSAASAGRRSSAR